MKKNQKYWKFVLSLFRLNNDHNLKTAYLNLLDVIIHIFEDLSGACLNWKMSYYHYGDPHYENKTASRLSYFYNGNAHTWKDRLYIETGPATSSDFAQASNINTKLAEYTHK